MFTRSGRGKIEVRITNLFSDYNGEKSISVSATTSTTAAEVVRLILEKCKRKEEPYCYQLWMICYDKSSKYIYDKSSKYIYDMQLVQPFGIS